MFGTALYGCETCMVNKIERNALKTLEMRSSGDACEGEN